MIKPFLSTAVLLSETIKSDVMKLIKVYLVIAAFLGTMIGTQAQTRTVLSVYPKHGTVVRTVSNPRVIVHKRTNYTTPMAYGIKPEEKNMWLRPYQEGLKLKPCQEVVK